MSAKYQKRGVTVRIERSSRGTSAIEVSEAGQAWFESGAFLARSDDQAERLRPFGSRAAHDFAMSLEAAVPAGLEIERYTILQGAAEHRIDGPPWRERFARVHLALVDRPQRLRLRFDLGGASFSDIDLRVVAAARTMRAGGSFASLQLPPHVTAALWPALLEAAAASGRFERRGFRIRQRPHPELARDGVGAAIVPAVLFDADRPGSIAPWPNYYRPSYRVPPIRAPLHLAAESDGRRTAGDATVIAIAEAPAAARHRVSAAFICQGMAHAYSMSVDEWFRRIEWIGEPAAWFPFGGGSWGADAVLRVEGLRRSESRTSSSPDRA